MLSMQNQAEYWVILGGFKSMNTFQIPYIGSDNVVIKVEIGSEGASPNDDIEIFKINFNIIQ